MQVYLALFSYRLLPTMAFRASKVGFTVPEQVSSPSHLKGDLSFAK